MNKPQVSNDSTSGSNFSSSSTSEFVEEQTDSSSGSSELEPEPATDEVAIESSVANTVDYDLSQAVSSQFYSDDALSLWSTYATREFIKEKHIDLETFGCQDVIALLRT